MPHALKSPYRALSVQFKVKYKTNGLYDLVCYRVYVVNITIYLWYLKREGSIELTRRTRKTFSSLASLKQIIIIITRQMRKKAKE